MISDLDKAVSGLIDCLTECFVDVTFEANGSSRTCYYINPKGELKEGTMRINIGVIPLLFSSRRTITGIVPKMLNKYYSRGPTAIASPISLSNLIDNIVAKWRELDQEYSSVIFYGDGDLWFTLQCTVADEAGTRNVVTFSFNTTQVPSPKEKKK